MSWSNFQPIPFSVPTLKAVKFAISPSQADVDIITPTAGKTLVLYKIIFEASVQGDVWFFDHTDNASHAIGPVFHPAIGGGWSETWPEGRHLAAPNNKFRYSSGTLVTGSGYCEYWEV